MPLQVEWYSALEGAVARIIKLVAGVEEEEPHHAGGSGGGGGAKTKAQSWAEQLERTYASVGKSHQLAAAADLQSVGICVLRCGLVCARVGMRRRH